MFKALRVFAVQACIDTALFGQVCDDCNAGAVWKILALVIEVLSVIVGAAAVIGVIVAGIAYATSAGDVAKLTSARKRIIQIAVGILAYGLAFTFLEWIIPGGLLSSNSSSYTCPDTTPKVTGKVSNTQSQTSATASSANASGSVTSGSSSSGTSASANFDATSIERISMTLPSGADFIDDHKCSDKVIYEGTTYQLTDAEIQKLAAMIYYENCVNMIACKTTASHMVNLYEAKVRGDAKDARGKTLYEWATTTQWYATRTHNVDPSRATPNSITAVKEVIINGHRTLPKKVINFDCGPWNGCQDTTYFVIQGKKVPPTAENIRALNPGVSKIGAKWGNESTFWCVVTEGTNKYGDIFKY